MITVTKKDLIALGYGTSFAADIIREAKKLMISKGHTYYGVSLCQCAGHGGGSFHPAACGSLIISRSPLPGVLAYQSAGSPHIERVRLPYAAPCAWN